MDDDVRRKRKPIVKLLDAANLYRRWSALVSSSKD
jgi:hypothetical protein